MRQRHPPAGTALDRLVADAMNSSQPTPTPYSTDPATDAEKWNWLAGRGVVKLTSPSPMEKDWHALFLAPAESDCGQDSEVESFDSTLSETLSRLVVAAANDDYPPV